MTEKISLCGDTKLWDLLTAYPWLKEELTTISDKFALLHSPVGKVMAKKATISEMSKRSGVEESLLVEKLEAIIAARAA